MEESKEMRPREQAIQSSGNPGEVLHRGLDEAMFKLLEFQAQQGADQNSTMLMLALMNLLGIVNGINKVLPEGKRVRGTNDLAGQIAGMLGGTVPTPTAEQGPAAGNQGGIDPAMIAALASMLGGPPRGPEGSGEGNRQGGGIDPAMLAALAGMMGGGPGGGGGANPAALLSMLANFMGPRRHPEAPRKEPQEREDKPEQPEDKAKQNTESVKKETGPAHRGMLKWDPRFGAPSSF